MLSIGIRADIQITKANKPLTDSSANSNRVVVPLKRMYVDGRDRFRIGKCQSSDEDQGVIVGRIRIEDLDAIQRRCRICIM